MNDVKFLIKRLEKECSTSNGYLGVEYDNLETDAECNNKIESLFNKIVNELNIMWGSPHEYIRNEFEPDKPFRSQRNVLQYMIRLGKFVHKYAPKYLPEEKAEQFINEVKQYVKID